MKKLLVVLLALTVVGVFAFAEDAAAPAPVVTIGGWARYEAIVYDQAGQQYQGPAWGQNGYSTAAGNYIDLSLNYDAKTFGVNGNLVGTAAVLFSDASSLRDYTAWAKVFDGKVKASIGKLRNGDYYLQNNDSSGFNSRIAGYGYTLQAYPVDGLSLGFFNPVADAADLDVSTFGYGASYAIPDVAKVIVQYLGASEELFVGADVSGVKDFPILVGYAYTPTEIAKISWQIGHNIDKLAAWTYGSYAVTAKSFNEKVYAEYNLGFVTPSAYVSFTSATSSDVAYGVAASIPAGTGALHVGVDADTTFAGVTTFSVPLYIDIGI